MKSDKWKSCREDMIILIFSLYLYLDYILSFTLFNNGIYEDYREYGSFMSYSYYSSLNGIGLLMKWLLISCYPVIILNMISCGYDKNKIKKRYILCGFEGWLYEIFNSSSLLNFFIILEYSILPLIYIIIEEGGENKYYSIYRIFLYTLFGSIFMLSYIIFYYNRFGTFMLYNLDLYYMRLMSIGFLIGLLIKIPIYPFHGWLPHAHIDAPSYGSMLLGGILLKIGTYGYIVLLDYIYDEIFILCCISMTKNSIEIIREIDIKKIIAYSSIIHMSLGLIGLSSYNREGFCGGILMSLGHGWISCGLFKIIGEIQIRYGFRSIMYLRGLKERSNKELMIYS